MGPSTRLFVLLAVMLAMLVVLVVACGLTTSATFITDIPVPS